MHRGGDAGAGADALQAYLRAIARLPPCTPEEERQLARRIRTHDDIESPLPPLDDDLVRRSLADRVRAALGELDDREREDVERRYGLDRDGEMRTLQEIGDALKLSRERIRQIEARAKEKLRGSKRVSELRSHLN